MPDIATTHGPIVFNDGKYIVRAIVKENGLHIYVHRNKGGEEIFPLGYWLGGNALLCKLLEET
jgi:hypothetical protein